MNSIESRKNCSSPQCINLFNQFFIPITVKLQFNDARFNEFFDITNVFVGPGKIPMFPV